MSFLTTILSFIVTVGVLVVIHELGHYLAARAMGVKILRFSVGFGRTLWTRRVGRDQTEWAVAAIPLGGYVKMLDEREGDVRPEERPRAFNRQGVASRSFIVLAGPAANFLLAMLVYWVLFLVGLPGMKPMVGPPPAGTAAAATGLANGDLVVSVAGDPVSTWTDLRWVLLKEAVRREPVAIEVVTARGSRVTRTLETASIGKDDLDGDFLGKLGLVVYAPSVPAVMGTVVPDSPAARAGLRPGDRVVAIDGRAVREWSDFTTIVRANAERRIALDVERGGQALRIDAVPALAKQGSLQVGRLGVEPPPELRREFERLATTVRYGPVEAIVPAARKVADISAFCLKMLGRMILGDVSWKNLSGPITIADYAGQSAKLGWVTWLGFLALVSVSLGVLNLLPIPLLDGGHLVYYFAEIVKGSPVSERTLEIGQRLGLAVLVGLTFFAIYNDINRLIAG